jgi:hypothetical protein
VEINLKRLVLRNDFSNFMNVLNSELTGRESEQNVLGALYLRRGMKA